MPVSASILISVYNRDRYLACAIESVLVQTYPHFELHETTVRRIVKQVEDILLKCGKFHLPSQRQLYQPGWEGKMMMVDVGEIEIEHPKKTRNTTTVANRNVTR